MSDFLDFSGKKVLVTGAAGGMGQAVCALLASRGAQVVLLDLNEEQLSAACQKLDGNGHCYYVCNLAQIENIEGLLGQITQEQGPVDGFVHCAGIANVRPLKMSKYSYMLDVMNVNYFSFVEIVRCITKRKAFNPGLSIVGICSIGAFYGAPTKTAYSSSKAAMYAAVKCMAVELADKGVRANVVAPGSTRTNMMEQAEDYSAGTDSYKQKLSRQYLGICEPEDIANSIAFLLSDKARMITGTCLTVDGGKMST
ncbi:MAG: SDR family oxidoreductase [Muribaculaceae bacterium]|nr:SDR family oxidoreductase [Muribaculaceae bacterium]